jgi:hypothetical protein
MRYVTFLFLLMLLASCLLPKKLDKFFEKKPTLAAQKCAENFPVVERVDTVTVVDSSAYKTEVERLHHVVDSLLGDSVSDSVKTEILTIIKEKSVPIVKYKYITKTVENTAKIKYLTDSCSSLTDSLSKNLAESNIRVEYLTGESVKYKQQRNRSYLWVLLLLLLLFRKPIVKAVSKIM